MKHIIKQFTVIVTTLTCASPSAQNITALVGCKLIHQQHLFI